MTYDAGWASIVDHMCDLEKTKVAGKLIPLGFRVWTTGGGCTCFGMDYEDYGIQLEFMVTDEGGCEAPDDDTAIFYLGIYTREDRCLWVMNEYEKIDDLIEMLEPFAQIAQVLQAQKNYQPAGNSDKS